MTRSHTRNRADERRVYDCYCRSDSHDIVQLDDVTGTHPDVAVTRRRSDCPFLRRAVNVKSRANAFAFCDSGPRNHRIRVTMGSRPGELARTKRIARARCIGTAPIAVRRYSSVTLNFLKGVAAMNLKYFNPL